jgi:hypothetical protein
MRVSGARAVARCDELTTMLNLIDHLEASPSDPMDRVAQTANPAGREG